MISWHGNAFCIIGLSWIHWSPGDCPNMASNINIFSLLLASIVKMPMIRDSILISHHRNYSPLRDNKTSWFINHQHFKLPGLHSYLFVARLVFPNNNVFSNTCKYLFWKSEWTRRHLNIRMSPNQYKDPHVEYKMVLLILSLTWESPYLERPSSYIETRPRKPHYNDVIMSGMVSQITRISIVCSAVGSGADQRKHQNFASLAYVWEIHRWPVNSSHKRPVIWKMFLFGDVNMHIAVNWNGKKS